LTKFDQQHKRLVGDTNITIANRAKEPDVRK